MIRGMHYSKAVSKKVLFLNNGTYRKDTVRVADGASGQGFKATEEDTSREGSEAT